MKRRIFLQAMLAVPAALVVPTIALAKTYKLTNWEPFEASIIKKDPLLYLEVSARRSGKTMRLVKHMEEYIERTGNYVYFIAPNMHMRSHAIVNYVQHKYHSKIIVLPKDKKDIDYGFRCYYEEADLLPKYLQEIKQNAYYSGTPHGDTGFLKKLADYNNGEYEKYPVYAMDAVEIENLRGK